MLMKKALLIALVAAIVAAWSVPAMAIDWTGSGFIGVYFAAFENMRSASGTAAVNPLAGNDYLNESGSFLALRARLMLKAQASPDLYGVFHFEINSQMFGETETGRNRAGVWDTDQVAIDVKYAYIDFRVPPKLPLWVRIGLIDFNLRSKVFAGVDGAGVAGRLVIDPIKLTVEARYGKVRDIDVYRAFDGRELYEFIVSMPVGPLTPGIWASYQNVRNSTTTTDDEELYWFGLYADGNIKLGGALALKPEFDFIYSGGRGNLTSGNHINYGSWLTRGFFTFVVKKFEFGVGGMYVMGRDWDEYDPAGGRDSRFQRPRTSGTAAGKNDQVVWHAGEWGGASGTLSNVTLGALPSDVTYGQWYVNGFAWYQLTDWLKVGAQVSYIGDTESGAAGGQGGDAIRDLSGGSNADADDDDSIGWEFDIGTQVALYKNLQWNSAFGYLFAGKALSLAGGVEPDDPWAFRSSLVYTF
jgi:hypothetical protein